MQFSGVQSSGRSAVQYIAVHCNSAICYKVKFNESRELNCCALKLHMTQFHIKGGRLVHRRDIFYVSGKTYK